MNEIVLYTPDELAEHIEVRVDEETVWLSQQQMASLFSQTKQNISLHINNCFREKELVPVSVVKESLTTASDGKKYKTKYYNLDVIISVGYRVKSKQGTQFRIWATNVLRDYLLKGYALNQRMNRIENTVESLATKVQEIDFYIKSNDLPQKGIFYDGHVFDAYNLIADIVRKAKTSIILIDNYIDDSVFTLFTKRKEKVDFTCYTKSITKSLKLDVEKHNQQYPPIHIKELKEAHDRFLIVDGQELYHIGASLKDLGKKWFAFSKMDIAVFTLLDKVNQKK